MSTRDFFSYLRIVARDGSLVNQRPRAAQIVIAIGEFMGHEAPPVSKRFMVASDPALLVEGTHLLKVWRSIRSESARQAVMDALVAIAEHDPD